jgi:hypothetical protein
MINALMMIAPLHQGNEGGDDERQRRSREQADRRAHQDDCAR